MLNSINSVNNNHQNASFKALKIDLKDVPGTVFCDGIRHALLPGEGEMVSKYINFAQKGYLKITEGFKDPEGLDILVQDSWGHVEPGHLLPTKDDTGITFGDKIKAKFDELINNCNNRRTETQQRSDSFDS